ncbi:alpha beta hydrolase [Fusarium beomiforme]|uniref:Alpha beta hydrolase n=1 Tax=Fusarium beomiforme TaxID=44412 RepID=A0A9P5AVS8_9HYPO|nr:alpha beta hydrolase [Fusarium beomiforme]
MSAERIASGFEPTAPEGVSPRFVGLDAPSKKRSPSGQHTCQGLYWTLKSKTPTIAFVATHYNADFSEHYLAGHLAANGYGFLGWNTRFRGLEDLFILEPALEDIGVGVRWLKEVAGIEKVILIGNSGGGSLMAAYHAKSQDDASLVKADAFIFVNSHTGRPDVFSNWLDPAVVDEDDPVKTDPTLDMYNPANGPPYSPDFIKRYRAAQIERNHRITEWVKKELQRLNKAGIPDRLFVIHRTMADLRFTDTTIDPSDRPANSCYFGDPAQANRGIGLAGRTSSLRTWLSLWSLRDSNIKFNVFAAKWNNTPSAVIQGTSDVGVFNSDARSIFDSLETEDKELHFVPGGHFFNDSQEVFDGALKLIVSWVAKRFP